MKSTFFLSLLLLAPPQHSAENAQGERGPVAVEVFASSDAVPPGGEFYLAAQITIAKGWHIQSPWASGDYIPLSWSIEPVEGIQFSEPVYSKDEEVELFGDKLRVYSGTVLAGVRANVTSKDSQKYLLRGKVQYQACNDKSCLPPRSREFEIPLRVQTGAQSSQKPSEVFSEFKKLFSEKFIPPPDSSAPKKDAIEKQIADQGLFLTLLGIFLLGLALNLTPCVYPVIAVTLGFFSKQSGAGQGSRFFLPLLYGLGIAATFTALGVITALTGGLFGSWLQSSWVQVGLAVLILALALSCFGVYNIQAPGWLLNKVGGGKAGGAGALLMGLVMGVTAAPCVGPFIISLLLYVAQKADVLTGLIWFGALSLGLALPYPILGFFSSSMQSLPKAGDWTEWVKRVMGLLLVAVSAFFLSSVFFPHQLLIVLAGLVLLGGIYMSLFDKTGREGKGIWFARGALFILTLMGAYVFYHQHQARGLVWTPYQENLVNQARREGKPVVIDFTASWCNPCRGLESFTFRDPSVIQEAERFVKLQVDVSSQTDEKAASAQKEFKVVGPPTIVFLSKDGREIGDLRVDEYISAEEFLARLKKVP